MANRRYDPLSGLHPIWFAGEEICRFLADNSDSIKPDEIMTYAEYIHDTITGTKKLFDKLLDARVAFVIQ
jgi:hypothetical protein